MKSRFQIVLIVLVALGLMILDDMTRKEGGILNPLRAYASRDSMSRADSTIMRPGAKMLLGSTNAIYPSVNATGSIGTASSAIGFGYYDSLNVRAVQVRGTISVDSGADINLNSGLDSTDAKSNAFGYGSLQVNSSDSTKNRPGGIALNDLSFRVPVADSLGVASGNFFMLSIMVEGTKTSGSVSKIQVLDAVSAASGTSRIATAGFHTTVGSVGLLSAATSPGDLDSNRVFYDTDTKYIELKKVTGGVPSTGTQYLIANIAASSGDVTSVQSVLCYAQPATGNFTATPPGIVVAFLNSSNATVDPWSLIGASGYFDIKIFGMLKIN